MSTAHEDIVKVTKTYLIALIISGKAGIKATAWPEQKKMWLNNMMKKAWTKMAIQMGSKKGRKDCDVKDTPTSEEVCKVQTIPITCTEGSNRFSFMILSATGVHMWWEKSK